MGKNESPSLCEEGDSVLVCWLVVGKKLSHYEPLYAVIFPLVSVT